MPDCNCCDGSCPETVSTVTVTTNTIDSDNALTITEGSVSSPTDPLTITLQVVDEDGAAVSVNALIKMWLVDVNDPAAPKSIVVPDEPGAAEFERVTDSDGELALVIQQSGELHTWYLCAEIMGVIYISDPFSLGA